MWFSPLATSGRALQLSREGSASRKASLLSLFLHAEKVYFEKSSGLGAAILIQAFFVGFVNLERAVS